VDEGFVSSAESRVAKTARAANLRQEKAAGCVIFLKGQGRISRNTSFLLARFRMPVYFALLRDFYTLEVWIAYFGRRGASCWGFLGCLGSSAEVLEGNACLRSLLGCWSAVVVLGEAFFDIV